MNEASGVATAVENDTWPPTGEDHKRIVRLIPASPGWTVSSRPQGRKGPKGIWEIPCWALTASGELFPMVPNDNLDGFRLATVEFQGGGDWSVNPPGQSYSYGVTRASFGEQLEPPKYAEASAEAIALSEDDEAVHVLWRWIG